MKPKANLKVVHKSKNRVRFIHSGLDKNSDVGAFIERVSNIDGVKSVRVNKAIQSVTIIYILDSYSSILDEISNLEVPKLKSVDEVSKAPIYRAGAALALMPFIDNNNANSIISLVAAYPLLKDGLKELLSSGLTSEVLEAMAVGISLSRNDYLAANSTNLLLNIGEYMEETTTHKSDDLIKALAKPGVESAWVEESANGKVELIKKPTDEIKVGDIVVVGAGETIAVDGYIIDGSASVNEASMTGEATSINKKHGDRAMSGTVVEDGKIKIWAEQTGADTSTERIRKYIQNSLNERSNVGEKAEELADKLVPITLSLAGLAYFLNKDMASVASVLQADYSCALKLATPVAFKSSIAKAGREGILIKGAKSLEELAKADTFVFDKTGTITKGILEVVDVISFDEKWSKESVLNLAASAEEHYFHPIAEAVVSAAKNKGFEHMHHGEVEFIVAHGLKTEFDGKEVVIGSRHFLEDDEKISFEPFRDEIKTQIDSGYTLLYIGYDKKLLGIITMKDEIRSSAKKTISKLKSLGAKEIIMLTGDIEEKANEVANELGIDKVYANMRPTGKAEVIDELVKSGRKVVFCGDGINDAPSLSKANVGISMKRGADIARAVSDVSLLRDDIYAVAMVKELANKTLNLVDRNFKATVAINSGILLGATLGRLSPIATAFLHNGTTIGLLLNSMKGVKIQH
ncbi:MAG: heavy metal translocating P-type ATPase [Campylobacteraceae bacterium]|nr:heavy metal translocating P-type ATPase [Campylobacteraceae bacterium]